MGVQKVAKLKTFGVFRDFSWPSDLPAFQKFNLIYGWNRSGKTTLARVFAACENKRNDFSQYPDGGQFEVVTDSNARIKSDNLSNCPLSIRVFNRDFIDENISFDPSSSCNPIIQVSKEDIQGEKQLKAAQQDEEKLDESYQSAKKTSETANTAEERFLKSTALIVKRAVGNLKVRDKYYAYDRGDLKKTLATTAIKNLVQLSDQAVDDFKAVIASEAKPRLTTLEKYDLPTSFAGSAISNFADIASVLKTLVEKKVVSETIDRLKDDPDLNAWVSRGLELHKRSNAQKCLFCEKPLENILLDRLSRHFSADYERLQRRITSCLAELEALRLEPIAVSVDLYPELKAAWQAKVDELKVLITELSGWVDEASKSLKEKKNAPLASIAAPSTPPDFVVRHDNLIAALNKVIDEHNSKVDNHEAEVKKKKDQLAGHLILEAAQQADYAGITKDLSDAHTKEAEALKLLTDKRKEISDLRKRTSNIGHALSQVNRYLAEFFGRKEIQLELDDASKGYVIHRDNEIATNLSEGEKTAIAFSYFLVKVDETGFRKQDGIIVIDDPISSFDSNFVFHCFSLIKNHFRDVGQLIVLTHNFDLFNLLKSWFCNMKKRAENCRFYMIENTVTDSVRYASLYRLEDTLLNYKSEYEYLFVKLSKFVANGQPQYDDLYTISNIARRFLEVFAGFKIPTTGDLASKLDQLIKDGKVNEVQKDKVYKLINEYSHGPDPTVAIEHKDKVEAQEAVRLSLQIVKESDSRHYDLLAKNLVSS